MTLVILLIKRWSCSAILLRYFIWRTVILSSCLSRFFIPIFWQVKINGLALLINSTIKIAPLTFDFNISFIHSPATAYRLLVMFAKLPFQQRRVFYNPTINSCVVNMNTSLCHHLFNISIAQRVSHIPPRSNWNNILVEVTPFKVDHLLHLQFECLDEFIVS